MGLKKAWGEAAFVLTLVTILFTLTILLIERKITEECATVLHTWIGFVGGTLPDTNQIDRKTIGFAAAMTLKLYLVLLPIGGVFSVFYRVMRVERRQHMQLIDLMEFRDEAIKLAILRRLNHMGVNNEPLFKQISDILDESVKEGGQVWEKEYLPRMFNEGIHTQLKEELYRNIG